MQTQELPGTVDTKVKRRRRWTDAEKKIVVDEAYLSGNISLVAAKHGIAPRLLFSWASKNRKERRFRLRLNAEQARELGRQMSNFNPPTGGTYTINVHVNDCGTVKLDIGKSNR